MTTPVIILRPEPGNAASLAAARALGLAAHGCPLFAVEAVAWEAPNPAIIDALLIGSANAPRHAGPQLAIYAGKPAYAVGETTAEVCRNAGLAVVATGSGGLQQLFGQLAPGHHRLLRLAGADRVALAPPPGVTLIERIAYASLPRPIPADLADLLTSPRPLVLLHSAEAARHFAAECARLALPRASIHLAALGPRVAEAAGQGWASLHMASATSDEALLALARQLCQEPTKSTKTG